jgi:penicillin-binding protein 1A
VRTREIVALVGSYEAVPGGLDRTSRAHRQPGSTFKLFVYAYALHARAFTPSSLLETDPNALPPGLRAASHDPEEGESSRRLRELLARSNNNAAIWTTVRVGSTNVVAFANSLGIESPLRPNDPKNLALGANEVTPLEMVGAYSTFAAGGEYKTPYLIQRIVGPNGVEIELPPRPPVRRVIDEAEAYITTSLLTSVVDVGTGKQAKSLGRPIAGKTGTTNESKDGWFVGYTPDIACAVWTGYDYPDSLGTSEFGATVALPAFIDFMRAAHTKRPAADFPVPAGIVHVAIDPASGLRAPPDEAGAIDEVFLAGTEPTELAKLDAGADASGEEAGAADAAPAASAPAVSSAPATPSPPAPPSAPASAGESPHAPEPPPF